MTPSSKTLALLIGYVEDPVGYVSRHTRTQQQCPNDRDPCPPCTGIATGTAFAHTSDAISIKQRPSNNKPLSNISSGIAADTAFAHNSDANTNNPNDSHPLLDKLSVGVVTDQTMLAHQGTSLRSVQCVASGKSTKLTRLTYRQPDGHIPNDPLSTA